MGLLSEMALLLLFVIGASAGWFASIIARTESAGLILRQIAIGLVASLVAGLYMNSGTFMGSLSWVALGTGLAAAIVLLAVHYLVFVKRFPA